MRKHKAGYGNINDLAKRCLVAYTCGRRMADSGVGVGTWRRQVVCYPDKALTGPELDVYRWLLPATWWAEWDRGWRSVERRDGHA